VNRKALIEELWSSAHYRAVVEDMASHRPIVPQFDYKNQTNLEEIKFKLAQQQYHDFVMTFFKPEGI